MDEGVFRFWIREALGEGKPSPDFKPRVLRDIHAAAHRRSWRPPIAGSMAVALLAIGLGLAFGYRVTNQSIGNETAQAEAGGRGLGVPVCRTDQVQLRASVERRVGTRFTYLSVAAKSNGPTCFLDLPVFLSLESPTGVPLWIQGNGGKLYLYGTVGHGDVVAGFSWANWCATTRSFTIRVTIGLGSHVYGPFSVPPPCAASPGEAGAPSALMPAVVLRSPRTVPVQNHVSYPFRLMEHCGLPVIDFGHTFWDAAPGQAWMPATVLSGTMVRLDDQHAEFASSGGVLKLIAHKGPELVDDLSIPCEYAILAQQR